ncbi:MAG: hypothetical protein ACE15C_14520 [Phycisphaerae bacterium]
MARQSAQEAQAPAAAASANVIVKLKAGVAFDGMMLRPIIDDSGRPAGRPDVVKPVKAIMPRDRAIAAGPAACEIIGDAPDGAAIGVIGEP